MKKIEKIVLLIALVAIFILPVALAEESIEVNEDTQKEIANMDTSHGAQTRLSQLEKAITRNILWGNETVNVLKESGKDTSELEALLAEMELLKTEVKAADPKSENTTQQFVDLKSDAINLTKEFREQAKTMLTATEAQKVRSRVNEINNAELQQIKNKIREASINYNYEELKKVYLILGMNDTSLLEKFKAGTATMKQVKEEIKARIQSMTPAEKTAAFEQIREAGIKKDIFRRASVEKAKLGYMVRKEARLTKRLGQVSTIKNEAVKQKLQTRITERLQQLNKAEDKLLNATQGKGNGGGRK